MKPVDYRNEAWADIQRRLNRLRLEVYQALLKHGPCTTRELAHRSGIDILTARPRVTELIELGWAELTDGGRGHEGVYRAFSESEARMVFECRRLSATGRGVQAELTL